MITIFYVCEIENYVTYNPAALFISRKVPLSGKEEEKRKVANGRKRGRRNRNRNVTKDDEK